jgi:hypothetical protein
MRYVSSVSQHGNSSWSISSQAEADCRCMALDDAGCVDCTNCIGCIGCSDCTNCIGCAYCVGCAGCADCTDSV